MFFFQTLIKKHKKRFFTSMQVSQQTLQGNQGLHCLGFFPRSWDFGNQLGI